MLKKILLSFILIMIIFTTSCSNGKHYDEQEYMLDIEYQDDFKILQLTDLHLGMKDDLDVHFDVIKKTVSQANPSLIVITGDLFTFATRRVVKEFVNFFDSFNIPWTLTFGNHDEQCFFSIDWLTNYFNEQSKNGSNLVFIDHQDDDVYGNANFVINLNKEEKIFEQLYILDSNRYNFSSFSGYDCLHQNQIDWYERMVNYTTKLNNNEVVPSMLFLHIPLCEFHDIYEQNINNKNNTNNIVSGEKNEEECNSLINTGMFEKIKELKSTRVVSCGHDHINDYHVTYQEEGYNDIELIYGIKSTNRIYHDLDMIGGKLFTIHNDHTISYEDIFVKY